MLKLQTHGQNNYGRLNNRHVSSDQYKYANKYKSQGLCYLVAIPVLITSNHGTGINKLFIIIIIIITGQIVCKNMQWFTIIV